MVGFHFFKLDTLPVRKFVHTLAHHNITKTTILPKRQDIIKSSHHEDYKIVLTFEWFGSAFLSMSVQSLAILADRIMTHAHDFLQSRVLLV